MEHSPVLVSLNQVCAMTSLSRTAVNYWRSIGRFPQAVPLGDKRIAFLKSEVEDWIRSRIEARVKEAA